MAATPENQEDQARKIRMAAVLAKLDAAIGALNTFRQQVVNPNPDSSDIVKEATATAFDKIDAENVIIENLTPLQEKTSHN